jgi:hypothetical protein
MKLSGPYLTLTGGLAVAGVLLALSANASGTDDRKQEAAGRAAAVSNATQANSSGPDDADSSDSSDSSDSDDAGADPSPAPRRKVKIVELVPSGSYAGSMGGGASIAVAVKDGNAIAYVCDGHEIEAWMQGKARAAALELDGKAGARLTGTFAHGRLSGTVKAAGQKWAFSVKAVQAPSGLYRSARNVRKAKVVGGWIVYRGKQVGMINSSVDGEAPAPPLELPSATAVVDGTELRAARMDGSPLG